MKKIYSIFILLFIATEFLVAQCDYTKAQYGFEAEKNVFVGIDLDFQLKPDSLFIDIYKPVGSAETEKPLVIWFFGGGFFAGARQDFAGVCEEMAKRGFVAATADYRLGFQGIGYPFSFDKFEIERAGFRGIQDAKAMLRYMKARHVQDGIDLNRVWIAGGSAGAFVAMGAAFADKESEKPKGAGAQSPANGINRPDLGSVDGNLQLNTYDTKVQGVFDIFGGLLDTNQIDVKDKIAVFAYHQDQDPVVPCGVNPPYWPYPFISNNYPTAYGSCALEQRFKNMNYPKELYKVWIYPGNEHATHDEVAVVNFMLENANPILCNSLSGLSALDNKFIRAYPNPAQEILHVESILQNSSFQILDNQAKVQIQGTLDSTLEIDISALHAGIYYLRVQNNLHQSQIKFIKL